MKRSGTLSVLLFLLFSCNKGAPVLKNHTTENQRKITKWFAEIDYFASVVPDSLENYAAKMELAAKNESDQYKAMAALIRGIHYASVASYELAMKDYELALVLLKNSKSDILKGRVYSAMGNYYKNTGDFPKAFGYFYKSLRIFEKYHDKIGIANVNCNIGQIYFEKNDMEAATAHLKDAMKMLQDEKKSIVYLTAAHHLANIYGMAGNYKSALQIDEEGIRITERENMPVVKVSFYDNKANCYMASNRLDSAQYYFNECLRLDLESKNKKQIADSYSNLGQLAARKHDFKKAEKCLYESITMLKKIKHKPNLAKSYAILVDIYAMQGEFKKALEAEMAFHQVYREMIDEKKESSLAEYRIVYDTQKKEKQLAENKVLLLQKEAESKQKSMTIIILSILAVFAAIVAFLIYRQQKLKSNQREQEFRLKTAISLIETQNKLQEQRLSISRDLHDNIGAQLTFIISSVDTVKYGFDLQDTKLSGKLDTISDFTKATIIELRDTIWAMNNNEITFEDLRARIFNFIEKAKIAKEDLHFKFNIDNGLNEIKLTSIQGINIYRTIQEALNNTIKYAEATEISIVAMQKGQTIEIEIKDNGAGFDLNKTPKGNGLHNMQKRIEDIDGKLQLTSAPGNGTAITIAIRHPKT